MVAYFVKKLELNSSIICNNKYRSEVRELFYVLYSPVATYMNIMQDKTNLCHRILIIKKCVDMWLHPVYCRRDLCHSCWRKLRRRTTVVLKKLQREDNINEKLNRRSDVVGQGFKGWNFFLALWVPMQAYRAKAVYSSIASLYLFLRSYPLLSAFQMFWRVPEGAIRVRLPYQTRQSHLWEL